MGNRLKVQYSPDAAMVYRKPVRRSPAELVLRILQHTAEPIRPTNLMSRMGFTWVTLNRYMNLLVHRGLVKRIPNPDDRDGRTAYIYHISEQGSLFLHRFEAGLEYITELTEALQQ